MLLQIENFATSGLKIVVNSLGAQTMTIKTVNEDIQLIRRKELLELLTISEATLWRWESENRIPGRVNLGPGRIAYRKSKVLAWIDSLATE